MTIDGGGVAFAGFDVFAYSDFFDVLFAAGAGIGFSLLHLVRYQLYKNYESQEKLILFEVGLINPYFCSKKRPKILYLILSTVTNLTSTR